MNKMSILIAIMIIGMELFFWIRARRKNKTPYRMFKKILLVLFNIIVLGILMLPAILFPNQIDIVPSGDHVIQTTLVTWEDKNRLETFTNDGSNRQVSVKFWYPVEDGNYPLIVFSHGAFGIMDSNASTCQELASHGYVVASMGHPYHSLFLKDANNKITFVDQNFMNEVYADNGATDAESEKRIYEKSQKWMELRSADENFALEQIISMKTSNKQAPFDRIRTDKIGLFGHSLGGATSVEVARMRSDIDAVIVLEGTMLGEYTGFANGTETFDPIPFPVPVLDVYSRDIYEKALPYGNSYVNFYLGSNSNIKSKEKQTAKNMPTFKFILKFIDVFSGLLNVLKRSFSILSVSNSLINVTLVLGLIFLISLVNFFCIP